jgi:hypothetical protein
MRSSLTTETDWLLRKTGWRPVAVLLAAAWLVPVLIHLVPWAGSRPLGVHLLPVFWTTFVAVYFYGAWPGLLVGLVTPGVNLLITGLPAMSSAGAMSLEVAAFALIAAGMVNRWPGNRLAAPLAYAAAKGMVIALIWVCAAGEAENPLRHLARSAQNGAAGLVVLGGINVLLARLCPRPDPWERE